MPYEGYVREDWRAEEYEGVFREDERLRHRLLGSALCGRRPR